MTKKSVLSQTEVQCTCSVAECTLHVHCKLNSVAAVYTAHAVYYTLQAAVYTASTLFWLSHFWLDTLLTAADTLPDKNVLYNTKFSRKFANPRDSRKLSAREYLVQVLSFLKLFTESKSVN